MPSRTAYSDSYMLNIDHKIEIGFVPLQFFIV